MFKTERQSLCYLSMKDDNVQLNIWQKIMTIPLNVGKPPSGKQPEPKGNIQIGEKGTKGANKTR